MLRAGSVFRGLRQGEIRVGAVMTEGMCAKKGERRERSSARLLGKKIRFVKLDFQAEAG
jgi:hypothetical protein